MKTAAAAAGRARPCTLACAALEFPPSLLYKQRVDKIDLRLERIADFNAIPQYAFFGLLQRQLPGEAARLGIQ